MGGGEIHANDSRICRHFHPQSTAFEQNKITPESILSYFFSNRRISSPLFQIGPLLIFKWLQYPLCIWFYTLKSLSDTGNLVILFRWTYLISICLNYTSMRNFKRVGSFIVIGKVTSIFSKPSDELKQVDFYKRILRWNLI